MNLIEKYIISLTNLYGIVKVDMVVDVYNSQNKESICIDDVIKYLDKDMSENYVYSYKEYFVRETIVEFDEFDLVMSRKANKPYYIPCKEEILKYVNHEYFEKNREYNRFLDYMNKNFFNDLEKAKLFCEDIVIMFQIQADIKEVMNSFNENKLSFKDENQINEVLELVMDLSNNVRLWENNGHTPKEIFERIEKLNLRSLLDKPYVIKNTIGRNDLCPCGSGKKYKKCCLGKDN